MNYYYKAFAFARRGKTVMPDDPHPSKACWDAYHEWLLLSKKEQEKYRV